MPFPSPPWDLQGQMWLSVFRVGSPRGSSGASSESSRASSGSTTERPAGLYGAAFVDYQEGGVLAYRELLVARLVRDGAVPRVHITDIWVDSEASRAGGRALWAIPKDLAEFHVDDRWSGPLSRTSCDAALGGLPVAAARFTGVHPPTLRTPYRFTTMQHRSTPGQTRSTGEAVVAGVAGSAKALPVRARWDFGTDGPLAWLHDRTRGARPLASFRLTDFRLTFGS